MFSMAETTATRTAIVTGGNRGIGRSITDAFLEAGYAVVVGARHDPGTDESRVRFVAMDVRNEGGHERLIEAARSWTGRVDVYVNNAGFSEWRPIDLIDEAFFDELIGTNLKGAFWGCKAAVRAMERGALSSTSPASPASAAVRTIRSIVLRNSE